MDSIEQASKLGKLDCFGNATKALMNYEWPKMKRDVKCRLEALWIITLLSRVTIYHVDGQVCAKFPALPQT